MSAKAALLAATVVAAPAASRAALSFYVDPTSPWPSGWYNAAVADMQTVVNMYNAYGDFGNGSIYVYYNAGIPTEQSGYGGWGGSIGVGGTYPNVRVLLHESSHWLGTGTYSSYWGGPHASALIQQFDGVGAVLNGDSQHYWPYGENYDNESSPINDARHVAMVYALREDFGIGSTAPPSAAKNVTLTASDAAGTSGFNYPWGWSDRHFAQPGTNYSTGRFDLRTPNGYPSWTFAGDSLTVNAGGRLLFNGWGTGGVVTVKNLTLAGGTVRHDQFSQDLFQLAGKITLAPNTTSTFDAANGNISVLGPIGGAGSLTKTGSNTLTLSGGATYSGSTVINAGTLKLVSSAPLASYSFSHVSGNTVVNDGTGGAAMNGTFNANGGSGRITTAGGPAAGLGALVLNGTGSTVDINSGITDLGGDSSWTVSAWVKTTQAGATILNKGNGTNWNQGFSTFYLGNGNNSGGGGLPDAVRWGGGWVAGSTPVNNGAWHQITYTSAGGNKTIYVDGVASPLAQNQFFNPDTGSKVRIGFAPDPGDGAATTNGSLSGIEFFNVALSADQAAQLYRGGQFSVLPTATNVSIAAGAVLDVNGVIQTIGALAGPSGSQIKLGGGGQLTVSSSFDSNFAGNISGGPGASLAKSGTGMLTLGGANTYGGGTTVSGGTLLVSNAASIGSGALTLGGGTFASVAPATVANNVHAIGGNGPSGISGPLTLAGPLTINDGAALKLLSGGIAMGSSGRLTIAGSGVLDLTNNSLHIQFAGTADPSAAITGYIASAYHAGAWDGGGIRSSALDANHGIGLAHDGPGDLLVAPALYGDTNLDGNVNFTDLLDLAQHYGRTNAAWEQGDFNYDGTVGFSDLLSLAQHFGQPPTSAQLATFSPAFRSDVEQAFAAVPEPAAMLLAGCATILCVRRRQK